MDKAAMTPRDTRKQQEAFIVFACAIGCALCVLIAGLAHVSAQFRHVAPPIRNWLLAAVGA